MSRSNNDGRKTIAQDVEHLRANNPDLNAPYGEWTDNEESWGGATIGAIAMHSTKSVIIGNGTFNEAVFPKMWTLKKDDSMERYNSDDPHRLGKFNAGSTESVMVLGNKGVMYHNFVGKGLFKTSIDIDRVIRDNCIRENMELATEDERFEFVKYQKLINPKFSLKDDSGSVLFVENLRNANTKKTFNQLSKFMTGLYAQDHIIEWKLYNFTKKAWSDSPDIICGPNDLSFGCEPIVEYIYKYEHPTNSSKVIYTTKEDPHLTLKYKITLKTYFFEKHHQVLEKKALENQTDEERVGYQIRRGGRLLTGIYPKRWNLTTGMNRAKGVRIVMDKPVCDEADEDFSIGTFKKITSDSWEFFSDELKTFLEREFKNIITKRDKKTKLDQDNLIQRFESLVSEVDPEDSVVALESLRDDAENELQSRLANKDVIKKKGSKTYKSVQNYIDYIQNIIDSKTDADVVAAAADEVQNEVQNEVAHEANEVQNEVQNEVAHEANVVQNEVQNVVQNEVAQGANEVQNEIAQGANAANVVQNEVANEVADEVADEVAHQANEVQNEVAQGANAANVVANVVAQEDSRSGENVVRTEEHHSNLSQFTQFIESAQSKFSDNISNISAESLDRIRDLFVQIETIIDTGN